MRMGHFSFVLLSLYLVLSLVFSCVSMMTFILVILIHVGRGHLRTVYKDSCIHSRIHHLFPSMADDARDRAKALEPRTNAPAYVFLEGIIFTPHTNLFSSLSVNIFTNATATPRRGRRVVTAASSTPLRRLSLQSIWTKSNKIWNP